jgi:hypothetical protein
MGGKQGGPRQRILLFPAACLILLIGITGCRTVVEPLEPGMDDRLDRQEDQLLDLAESLLQKGDYAGAVDVVDQAISCCTGRFAERALHILGNALAAPDNPMGEHSPSIRCFKRLEISSSDSVPGPAARCWVAALNEVLANEAEIRKSKKTIQDQMRRIRELERQIEQLKAVDLEPETPKTGGMVP